MALLEVRNLVKHFPVHGGILNREIGRVHAVNGVSFDIEKGEIVGIVGESGCGKSTLGKALMRLHEPTSGSVRFDGKELIGLDHKALMPFRRRMQIIFQDPYSSLNPRLTIRGLLKEAVKFHGIKPADEIEDYIQELIRTVGLRPDSAGKFPHEFSGGQRQRIGIARALCVQPEVLNLMRDLKDKLGLTMIFVSHDLKVIEHFCDRVLVMYLGHIVEELPTDNLSERAKHPYTRALLGANPIDSPDQKRPLTVLKGDVPSPFNPPTGCPFQTRCPEVMDICRKQMPPLEVTVEGEQRGACWAVNQPIQA